MRTTLASEVEVREERGLTRRQLTDLATAMLVAVRLSTEGVEDLSVVHRRWQFVAAGMLLAAAMALLLTLSGRRASAAAEPSTSDTASHYAVLQRAASLPAALPAQSGHTADLSRQVDTAGRAAKQWIAVSGDQVCVVIQNEQLGAPSACGSQQLLAQHSEIAVLEAGADTAGVDPTRPQLHLPTLAAGIVPNGVQSVTVSFADGTSKTASVVDNAFQLGTSGVKVVRYTWTTSDGVSHDEP